MKPASHATLLSGKNTWYNACQQLEQKGEAYCLATILVKAGSIPGEVGAKMLITAEQQFGTLGGGKLEYQVTGQARHQLKQHPNREKPTGEIHIERFSLNKEQGQHCGGSLQILFEYRNLFRPNVAIFGAGHVCQALCAILADLPCSVTVVDSKKEWLEVIERENIRTIYKEQPISAINDLDPNSHILVMTHDHRLDNEVVLYAMERQCFPYIGLIGSKSKRRQSERYLTEHLSDPLLLQRLTCPVGRPDIKGHLPMQVAVSIAAQLMDYFARADTEPKEKPEWLSIERE